MTTHSPNTKPPAAPRAEDDAEDGRTPVAATSVDDDVADHYEEMTELGAKDRGEGRLP